MGKMRLSTISDGFKVLKFSLSAVWKLRKSYLLLRILIAFMCVGETFWEIIILRKLINDITLGKNMEIIFTDVILLCAGIFIFKSLNVIFNWLSSTGYIKLCDSFAVNSLVKKMNMKYPMLENPAILDKIRNLWRTDGVVSNSIEQLYIFISGIAIFAGSVSILSTLNILLVFAFVIITVFNSYITRKSIKEINRLDIEKSPVDRKLAYYKLKTLNAEDGKEVRVFNIQDYYIKKINSLNNELLEFENKKEKENLMMNMFTGVMNNVQTFLLYMYSSLKYIRGEIIIADFFMYITTISKLSSSFETIITAFQKIAAQKEQLDRLKNYMELPEEKFIKQEKENETELVLEFKNVSFRYPNTDKNVLNNVNIAISSNQKISIVGENGAGKSTFIKLLCRLYEPNEGEILLNGKNIYEYNYKNYIKMISIVFQDYKLTPFTVRDNMQLNRYMEDDYLLDCLQKADIGARIKALENGLDTYIGKGTGYNGIDMSGGEKQKLAIGRMYAKNANILILDEATAAVDPISEDIIFSNMNNKSDNQIVIFISHRMSNARFSDKIIFIDNGKIEEFGKHEDLMNKDGGYAKLFKLQEQYYKN